MNEKEIQIKEHKSLKKKLLNQEIKGTPELLNRPEKEIKECSIEMDKDYLEKEGITWR